MAFSATWEGAATCRAWPSATTSLTPTTRTQTTCAPTTSWSGRPPTARLRQRRSRSPPSWCALSMLFSDWDRSGRRDLRISNDRHYYSDLCDGRSSCGGSRPGEPPRLYTAADGWVPVRLQGMGIGSYDVTGDGYPGRVSDEPGFEHPSVAPGRSVAPGVSRHRPQARGCGHSPFNRRRPAAVDFVASGVPGREQRWFHRPVRLEGQRRDQQPDYATKDPSRPVPRSARWHVRPMPRPPGSSTSPVRGARPWPISTSTACSTWSWRLPGAPVRIWRNVGIGDALAAPAPMGHWIGVKATQPGPNRDAIGAWLDIAIGDTTTHPS